MDRVVSWKKRRMRRKRSMNQIHSWQLLHEAVRGLGAGPYSTVVMGRSTLFQWIGTDGDQPLLRLLEVSYPPGFRVWLTTSPKGSAELPCTTSMRKQRLGERRCNANHGP